MLGLKLNHVSKRRYRSEAVDVGILIRCKYIGALDTIDGIYFFQCLQATAMFDVRVKIPKYYTLVFIWLMWFINIMLYFSRELFAILA